MMGILCVSYVYLERVYTVNFTAHGPKFIHSYFGLCCVLRNAVCCILRVLYILDHVPCCVVLWCYCCWWPFCVCCISWTVLYQPLVGSMGEFVRGSITQLNARKHFSKEMMNTICGAALQLPSISAAEKKFIDVNTLCLNFQHIIRIILPEFPYFRKFSFEAIWEGELKLWWTGSNFHLNWILFLPFFHFQFFIIWSSLTCWSW